MKIYTERRGNEVVLVAVVEEYDSLCLAKDFARIGEPLVAVLKKDPGYKYPHLELRKEIT